MALKSLLIITVSIATITVSQAETFETSDLLRFGSAADVQQILLAIFTPIQALITNILNLICSLIPPLTATVEALRSTILETLISLLGVLGPVLSLIFPQIALLLQVLPVVLDSANQLLYNGTTILQEYGCSTILSINDLVSNIINSIIGIFSV